MTEAERIARHERAIERFNEEFGPAYSAWLDAQPRAPRSTCWAANANDNAVVSTAEPANDNMKDAA